jgi:hypothetical protein
VVNGISAPPKSASLLYPEFRVLSREIFELFQKILGKIFKRWFSVKWVKNCALFLLGGLGYVCLELLWRGWSHVTMFFAGGISFLLLGKLSRVKNVPLLVRGILGALIITGVELVTGLIFNRSFEVWDYRAVPMNFLGQICLPFTVLWVPISIGAMILYNAIAPRN